MEKVVSKKKIRSFRDLEVYQESYDSSLVIAREVLPKIPEKEKYDLVSQLSRSSKAIPRLIAEGYAKKHQKSGFQKYIDDAMAEANETVVSLSQAKDIYHVEPKLCDKLVDQYDKTGRQLFKLAEAWDSFKQQRRSTKT